MTEPRSVVHHIDVLHVVHDQKRTSNQTKGQKELDLRRIPVQQWVEVVGILRVRFLMVFNTEDMDTNIILQ